MPLDDILEDAELRMMGAGEALQDALRGVRTGRASAGLVDGLEVEAYGTTSPLKALANIATPDARLIVIRPFDPNTIADIEKAIMASELGLNPASDGKSIRLTVPPLSEERRKQMGGLVRSKGEEAKVSIRNVRRDANKDIDKTKKDGSAPEDDCFKARDKLQEVTKAQEKEVDDLVARKIADISEV